MKIWETNPLFVMSVTMFVEGKSAAILPAPGFPIGSGMTVWGAYAGMTGEEVERRQFRGRVHGYRIKRGRRCGEGVCGRGGHAGKAGRLASWQRTEFAGRGPGLLR